MHFPKKRFVAILSLIVASHFAVSAKKTYKKSSRHHHTYAQSKSHSKKSTKKTTYHVKDTRPEMTIADVKDSDKLWGIDVSHYQAEIDWLALSKEKPNFMFIKASEGINMKDSKYSTYYSEAKKLGIPVGSYHFFSYKSSGKEQAANFLSVAQHSSGDLLPVLDAEYVKSMPEDKARIKAELIDFVTTVYNKLGLYPIIYCNYRYFQAYLAETILQTNCKLWIVDYRNEPNCPWTLWQSTNKFKLSAIKGHVDLNFFNGNMDMLKDIFVQNINQGKLF